MTVFISLSACNGCAPERIAQGRIVSRPVLLTKLLANREVVRYIRAPFGFGKSSLAYEYAQTVFDFRHVFWIDCSSPCFLRDLDDSDLAKEIFEVDEAARLVVFDDVPHLNEERSHRLSEVFDELMERKCEVLVCSVPSCDSFNHLQRDRICIDSDDMLLTDDETDDLTFSLVEDAFAKRAWPRSRRIAGSCWGSMSASDYLKAFCAEEMPSEWRLIAFVAFVCQKGTFKRFDEVMPGINLGESIEQLARCYPYLGLNVRSSTFEAMEVAPDIIAGCFEKHLEMMAYIAVCADVGSLVLNIASSIALSGDAGRACEVAGAFLGPYQCAKWLLSNAWVINEQGVLYEAHRLHGYIGRQNDTDMLLLQAHECWRMVFLEGFEKPLRKAYRIALDEKASRSARLLAASLVFCYGDDAERNAVYVSLEILIDAIGQHLRLADIPEMICFVMGGDEDCFRKAATRIKALIGSGMREDAIMGICAAYVNRLAVCMNASDKGSRKSVDEIEAIDLAKEILNLLAERLGGEQIKQSMYAYELYAACQKAFGMGILTQTECEVISGVSMSSFARYIATQKERYLRQQTGRLIRQSDYLKTHPDLYRRQGQSSGDVSLRLLEPVPLLYVGLFGGMVIRVGDRLVDPHTFRRMKAKTMLAILVLYKGREINRDRLVALLWPDSDLESARHNFYCVWGQLRHALMLPSGNCPYLIKNHDSVRIDARYLRSDIFAFDDVCRRLMFSEMGAAEWQKLFGEITGDFAQELVPGEQKCAYLRNVRNDYTARLVDSLLHASKYLCAQNELEGSLWFAREAKRRDACREDVYTTLMLAQEAAGQRSEAIETYQECKHFLNEELGIDPSVEISSIYNRVIDAEAFVQ
ncbi:MAG: hypothetical protein J6Y65_02060 [Eggerthellaceae bacterium]|nr:hypothetical protein [Eggerthellaceae bacterium]